MIEKRFTLDNEENGLCKCILMNGEEIPTCEVVELLNTFNDENEQLKARITYLERKIQRERASAMKQHLKWSKEAEEQIQILAEENEELKAQLYCDDEEGICNICKHHYLVKDDESEFGYYNSRCKKRHYECARVSLKHCEDFKFKELEE